MKNVLALVGLLVVSVAGLGWYLGWYDIGRGSSEPGKQHIDVQVNTDKIKKDVKQGEEKLHDILKNHQGQLPVAPLEKIVPAIPTGGNGLNQAKDGSWIITVPTPGGQSSPNGGELVLPPPPMFPPIKVGDPIPMPTTGFRPGE